MKHANLFFFSVPKKLLDNSVLKGNIITSPDMIKVCLIAQNFQIWCKGLGVRGRELRLSTCLLVTNNKSPRIVDSQTKILGANFTSKPFGYEPKNIFCSPDCTYALLQSILIEVCEIPQIWFFEVIVP